MEEQLALRGVMARGGGELGGGSHTARHRPSILSEEEGLLKVCIEAIEASPLLSKRAGPT